MEWIVLLFYIFQMQSAGKSANRCVIAGTGVSMDSEELGYQVSCDEAEKDSALEKLVSPVQDVIHEKSDEKVMFRDDMPAAWQVHDAGYEKAVF